MEIVRRRLSSLDGVVRVRCRSDDAALIGQGALVMHDAIQAYDRRSGGTRRDDRRDWVADAAAARAWPAGFSWRCSSQQIAIETCYATSTTGVTESEDSEGRKRCGGERCSWPQWDGSFRRPRPRRPAARVLVNGTRTGHASMVRAVAGYVRRSRSTAWSNVNWPIYRDSGETQYVEAYNQVKALDSNNIRVRSTDQGQMARTFSATFPPNSSPDRELRPPTSAEWTWR